MGGMMVRRKSAESPKRETLREQKLPTEGLEQAVLEAALSVGTEVAEEVLVTEKKKNNLSSTWTLKQL